MIVAKINDLLIKNYYNKETKKRCFCYSNCLVEIDTVVNENIYVDM